MPTVSTRSYITVNFLDALITSVSIVSLSLNAACGLITGGGASIVLATVAGAAFFL